MAVMHELLLTTNGWHIALVAGSLAALLTLQFAYFNRPSTRLRSGQSVAMLFVQACLIYLPMLPLQRDWVSWPSLLMGCALLVLPPVAGWLSSPRTPASTSGSSTSQGRPAKTPSTR